jgi:hypothetical protein
MKKEFIPYELALRMKRLGFDEPCCGYYDHTIKELDTISSDVCERLCKHDTHIKAPTYSQVFRWFRGKYNIHIRIEKFDETKWWANWGSWTSEFYDSYEEAELHCLEKLMDIVEQKNSK